MSEYAQLIHEASKARPSVKRLSDLIDAIDHQLGGFDEVAKLIAASMKVKGAAGARSQSDYVKLVLANIRLNHIQDDVEALSDEELAQEASELASD